VLLPVRYIPLWKKLVYALDENSKWNRVYQDSAYAVWDKTR